MTDHLVLCLVVILSCSIGIYAAENTENEKAVDSAGKGGLVMCQECTIVKSMDNQVLSIFDEVTHTTVSRCQEYQCNAGQDWCLVTYYKNAASEAYAQNKHEVHECGNKEQRDSDYRCQELFKEDAHDRIQYCKTKRSGTTDSVFAVSFSILISIVFLFLY